MQNNNLLYDELISPTCELLKNRKIETHKFEKPKSPTCIFYFGERSADYQEEMNNDLTRGWGDSASEVMHYKIGNPDRVEDTITDFSGNKITIPLLQSNITHMMSSSDVFSDMNYIYVYCILETTAMSADEFKRWYSVVNELERILVISLRTSLMVLINQSLNYIENTKKIRTCLYDLYSSDELCFAKSHLYDAVFLFSNRLKNGQYINLDSGSQDYIDYNLYADIVLLTNTDTPDVQDRIINLYDKKTPAFTAAYSNLSKPIRDIAMIIIKKCVDTVKDSLDSIDESNINSENLIANLLNINNGQMPFINEFYSHYIYPELQDMTCLDYLPLKNSCRNIPYEKANADTMNCLDMFVKENYIDLISEKININKYELMRQLKDTILKNISAEQQKALQYFTGNIKDKVNEALSSAIINFDRKNVRTEDAIRMMAKRSVIEQFVPLVTEVLIDLKTNAQESLKRFEQLYHEIGMTTIVGKGALRHNIQPFYENIVEIYYLDQSKKKRIVNAVTTGASTKEDMLGIIRNEMSNIISSNPVFGMSFVDELVERIEALGESTDVGQLIAKELVDNLNNRVALNSYSLFNDRYYEAYFLNTMQNSGKNSLFNALKQTAQLHNIPVSYYNTLSNNMVESVWFYKCTEENVSI